MKKIIRVIILSFSVVSITYSLYAQQGNTFNPFTGNMDLCVTFKDSSSVLDIMCGPLITDDGMLTDNGDGTYSYSSTVNVPISVTGSCSKGQYAANSSYLYVCYADNSWKRVALSTF